MKGRHGKGPPPADLLVCFPSRAHLTLMPKPICSPARPSESSSRNLPPLLRRRRRHNHLIRKPSIRAGGHSSPLMWSKTKPNNSDISEPTSPKVTCAGQIKIRPKPSSCKNWQSVMEEIERLHNSRKQKRRLPWIEAFGFKKDVMQFLTCLRNIRFDFRCFGAFPTADVTSDDEDDDDDDDDDETYRDISRFGRKEESCETDQNSKTVFSKWFMILQENNQSKEDDRRKGKMNMSDFDQRLRDADDEDDGGGSCAPPPPNALLLMRCRSAPAKSWLEEKEEEEDGKSESEDEKEKEKERETEETERKQSLVVMRCGTDFSKLSSDIAKETWVVGGIKDMLSRSRSWKR